MRHHELIALFDPSALAVFGVVAKEHTTRFKELLDALASVGLDREDVRERLDQLEEAKLIKPQDAPEGVEDFKWYYIAEEGLTAERELRRLRMVG